MTPALELKTSKTTFPHTDKAFLVFLGSFSADLLPVLNNPDNRVQVIYTQIDRKKDNTPVFTHYYYHIDPNSYFYPASTVKMPVAVLALQKLNELKINGLDKNATMVTEAAFEGQTPVYNDPNSADGRPTVANYVKKIFLASDNDAFNRLYEFLGQQYINEQLHQRGYDSVQIIHRLDVSLSEDQHRKTNPVVFYDSAGYILYQQPLIKSIMPYQSRQTRLGKGFRSNGVLVEEPFDFSKKNLLTLIDLHSIMMSVLFPASMPAAQRFHLTEEDYRFLYRYMSMLPRESDFPQYDSTFPDAFVKFLYYGGSGNIEDSSLRIFNKIGDAYGFLTETAYFTDFKNGVEFMLSATIYCNSDGIFNDDKYDYQSVGFPFMKTLGRAIYAYEMQRKRKHQPNLSTFRFSYERKDSGAY